MARWHWVFWAAVVVGCGGRTERESWPPEERETEPEPAPPGQQQSSGKDGGTGTSFDGSVELGPCMPGFDPAEEPTRPCNWVAAERCFEDKLDACACVCPASTSPTVCSSGFPQEGGRVEIYCY